MLKQYTYLNCLYCCRKIKLFFVKANLNEYFVTVYLYSGLVEMPRRAAAIDDTIKRT